MKKPIFEGKWCSTGCAYWHEFPFCIAYGENLKSVETDHLGYESWEYPRCPDCIAEHGLDGSQWSREVPRDEGHYRVYLDGAKDPTVALVYFLDGEILIDVPGMREGIGPGRVKRWGPRIEFPELPEDSNEQ